MIFRSLSCDPGLCDGIGRLMFEVCKGVSQRFHSCCEWVWPLLLSQLGSPELHVERVAQALGKMVELMAEHTRKEYADPVWQPLLVRREGGRGGEGRGGSDKITVTQDNVDSIQKRLKDHIGNGGGVASLLCAQLNHTLYLIGIMVSWRNGFRITNKPRLFQVMRIPIVVFNVINCFCCPISSPYLVCWGIPISLATHSTLPSTWLPP